jgi:excinuclease ABC subunit B
MVVKRWPPAKRSRSSAAAATIEEPFTTSAGSVTAGLAARALVLDIGGAPNSENNDGAAASAAADLNFEEAARLRDEIKRLRATELAVVDDPTAKVVNIDAKARDKARDARRGGASSPSPRSRGEGRGEGQPRGTGSAIHKPDLDEMGIALYHERAPHRPGAKGPRKPNLDEMGPGPESAPYRGGPRSTMGRPGQRGGFKPKRR